MRPASTLALVAAIAVMAAPAVAPAAKHRKAPSACQQLQKRYKDLSPNRRLVLVRRGSMETGDISACVLPRGKVRRLAQWDDGLARAGYRIVATKGWFVLIDYGWSDQYGGSTRELSQVDARTGHSTSLSYYSCEPDGPFGTPCPDGTDFGKAALAPSGAGALELIDLATKTTSLQSFDPAGTLARLDDGPVDSLAIDGTDIVWTRAGAEHRAPLPGSTGP